MEGMVLGEKGTATNKTAGPADLQQRITEMHEEVRNRYRGENMEMVSQHDISHISINETRYLCQARSGYINLTG
jgi:hypothetical protein